MTHQSVVCSQTRGEVEDLEQPRLSNHPRQSVEVVCSQTRGEVEDLEEAFSDKVCEGVTGFCKAVSAQQAIQRALSSSASTSAHRVFEFS